MGWLQKLLGYTLGLARRMLLKAKEEDFDGSEMPSMGGMVDSVTARHREGMNGVEADGGL